MIRIELRIEHLCQSADRSALSAVVVVESSYIADDVCHLIDSIVASLRSRSVAGDSLNIYSDLHTSSVSSVDTAVCRLCRDDEIDLVSCIFRTIKVLVYYVLPAHSVAVLFHYGSDYHDLISFRDESEIFHDLCAVYSRSHSAFLVGAAASVNDVVCLISLVRIVCPVVDVSDTYCIDVGIDGDDLVSLAHPADDISEAVYFYLVIAKLFHLSLDACYYFAFLSAFARMRDHVSQKSADLRSVSFCCFLYGFIIRNHFVYLRVCNELFLLCKKDFVAKIIVYFSKHHTKVGASYEA